MFSELTKRKKVFVIDVRKNLRIYSRPPKLYTRLKNPKTRKSKKLRMHQKPQEVGKLVDNRRWKSRVVRETSHGPLIADFQEHIVWVEDTKTKKFNAMRLIIRRDKGNSQIRLKFSISNSLSTSLEELAFKQGQRFWVEQSIKECKQQAGLGDYQVRTWRAWHHHFTMVMLAHLFLLEIRSRGSEAMSLFSAEDIRMFLRYSFPSTTDSPEGILKIIKKRQKNRFARLKRIKQTE